MRVIKYFFEEPTLLDFPETTSDTPVDSGEQFVSLMSNRHHHRGYLAASDLNAQKIGGSSLEDEAAANVLAGVLEGPIWLMAHLPDESGSVSVECVTELKEIERVLTTMRVGSVAIAQLDPEGHHVSQLVGESDRKHSFKAIVRLLDLGATLVFPEPAHVGHDWSLFSAQPLSERFMDQLTQAPADCRCFVVPFVKARGEHKFYFEQYDVEFFKEYEVAK